MSLPVNSMSTPREEQVSKTKSDFNRASSRKSTPVSPCHPEAQSVMTTHFPKKFTGRKTLYLAPPGAQPTLADAIALLHQDEHLSSVRRRDLISALQRIAAACDLPVNEVPADPNWLRQKVSALSPVKLGLSAKTRSNILSNATIALSRVGITKRRPSPERSPKWQQLWVKLSSSGKITLGSFTKFCTHHQIDPDDVTDEVVRQYREAVVLSSLRKKPDELIHDLTVLWNRSVDGIPGWPTHRLTVLKRRKVFGMPEDALPKTFRDDMAIYLSRGQNGALLDHGAPPPLAKATVNHRRIQICRFFGELISDGVDASELPDLRSMVRPAMAYRGLDAMLRRRGGMSSGNIHNMAYMLLVIAKHHAKLSDDEVQRLKVACKRLKIERRGMTKKNRERINQFDDAHNLNRLLLLPEELVKVAQEKMPVPERAAALVEIALAIELLTLTSLRIKNIAGLHLDNNFQWSRSSRRGVCHLVIDGRDVKNGIDRDYELQGQTVTLLKTFIERYRPSVAPVGNRWLFTRRDGSGPVSSVVLGRRIQRVIRGRTGLTVNPHLFRSLGGTLFLDRNPGAYEVVRQVLGHKHISTTMNHYLWREAVSAAKLFDHTLQRVREQARSQVRGARKQRRLP